MEETLIWARIVEVRNSATATGEPIYRVRLLDAHGQVLREEIMSNRGGVEWRGIEAVARKLMQAG